MPPTDYTTIMTVNESIASSIPDFQFKFIYLINIHQTLDI